MKGLISCKRTAQFKKNQLSGWQFLTCEDFFALQISLHFDFLTPECGLLDCKALKAYLDTN